MAFHRAMAQLQVLCHRTVALPLQQQLQHQIF
jgi:hypothetical protein